MPEFLKPADFSEETKKEISKVDKIDIGSNEIANILKDDVNFIGEGGRTIVATIEDAENKLVAIARKEMKPEEAKRIYYNHKILYTLFPEHFARIYATAGKTKEVTHSLSYTIRERVFGEHPKIKAVGDFKDVIKQLAEIGISIQFDTARRNFIVGVGGHTIYVDLVNFAGWKAEHEKLILDWMEKRKMKDADKDLVRTSLHRLLVLSQQTK